MEEFRKMSEKLTDAQYDYLEKKVLLRGIFYLQICTLFFVVCTLIIVTYGGVM